MDGVDRGETTTEAVMEEQERLLGEYRAEWTHALLEGTETDLRAGLLRELALYSHAEPEEMERRLLARHDLRADLLAGLRDSV